MMFVMMTMAVTTMHNMMTPTMITMAMTTMM